MKNLIKFLILMVLVLSAASYGKNSAQKDFEAIVERIKSAVDSDLDVSSMEALKRFFEKMEYKINKTTLDGSTKATINTTVRVINLPAYAEDYMEQIMPLVFEGASEEIINENAARYFIELFKKEDLLYKETTIDVTMAQNVNGTWEIVDGEDELYGAILTVFMELESMSDL